MNQEQVINACIQDGIRLTRFLYVDNGCTIRGKLVPTERLSGRMASGQGLTVAMQAMNMLDQLQAVEGMGPVGEIRLVPDPESFVILPYAPNSAAMMCDMIRLDKTPWDACPRSFLKRMIAQAAAHGLTVQAAFEGEFSLFRREGDGSDPSHYQPIDTGLCFSSTAMHAAAPVIDAIMAAFAAQNIPVDAYYPELGHGQHELPLRHAPALRAADNQIWFRETVRSVAANHGLVASLAPKPKLDQAGNGCHIHWSLWDAAGETNLLYDGADQYLLSRLGYHFIGGLLAHLPGLLALTTPSYNSFHRLQPHFWSSAYTAWGPDNREAAVRVASGAWGSESTSINLELKASDASNNPYLALGGLIVAGLDGIARELEPGAAALIDPGNYSDAERSQRGIRRYPTTQAEALDALEQDDVLMDALGSTLATAYLAVKRSEYAAFAAEDEAFEVRHHIEKF
ncbi:MAG TPA: glutamine synthetase family protein [Caldilineaceae bacterium]|nr:glutamine synthetase family protein [Caldilineaceae bacterium]